MELMNINIENKDGILVVSSRIIAKQLNKKHKNILRLIDSLEIGSDLSQSNFIENTYFDGYGRPQREVLLTKKGFTIYMFNIQGYNEFKISYVDRFEEMENHIKNNQYLVSYEDYKEVKQKVNILEKKIERQITLDHGEQRKLQKSISTRVYQREEVTGVEKKKLYSALHRAVKDTFGVASYRDIKREELKDALNFIYNWIEKSDLREEYSA